MQFNLLYAMIWYLYYNKIQYTVTTSLQLFKKLINTIIIISELMLGIDNQIIVLMQNRNKPLAEHRCSER